jgi:ligand-binding sensor protein
MNNFDWAESFIAAATIARLHEAAAAVARTAGRTSVQRGQVGGSSIAQIWNLNSLQRLQDIFAESTRSASIIIDTEGNLVTRPSNFNEVCLIVQQTAKGRKCCDISNHERSARALRSDAPVYHMCHSCGFLDGSVPIIIGSKRLGYWLVGQCNALGVSREDIAVHARTIGADVEAMLKAYDRSQPTSVDHYEQILELLYSLVRELTARIEFP